MPEVVIAPPEVAPAWAWEAAQTQEHCPGYVPSGSTGESSSKGIGFGSLAGGSGPLPENVDFCGGAGTGCPGRNVELLERAAAAASPLLSAESLSEGGLLLTFEAGRLRLRGTRPDPNWSRNLSRRETAMHRAV